MHCSGLYEGATIGHRLVTIINPPFRGFVKLQEIKKIEKNSEVCFFGCTCFPPQNIENILKMDRGGGCMVVVWPIRVFLRFLIFFNLTNPISPVTY